MNFIRAIKIDFISFKFPCKTVESDVSIHDRSRASSRARSEYSESESMDHGDSGLSNQGAGLHQRTVPRRDSNDWDKFYRVLNTTPLGQIYQIQVHSLWIEQIIESLLEFRTHFPSTKDANLILAQEKNYDDSKLKSRLAEEDKFTAWYNNANLLLDLLEYIISRLELKNETGEPVIKPVSVGELKLDELGFENRNQGLVEAGTSHHFKNVIRNDMRNMQEHNKTIMFDEAFIAEHLKNYITTAVMANPGQTYPLTAPNQRITRTDRRGPYNALNRQILSKFLPTLLKVNHNLAARGESVSDEQSQESLREIRQKNRGIQAKSVRSLSSILAPKIGDNEWLKRNLDGIVVKYTIVTDTERILEMPSYCPKLDLLYELILSVLLRIPLGLKDHVIAKLDLVKESHPDDYTNFISEIRPVLEEFKLSLFCVECLDIHSKISQTITKTLNKTRLEFKRLLHLYVTEVVTPSKSYLMSSNFDRSSYLQRLNKGSFMPSEACSIASVLKHEFNNLSLICSSSKMVRNNLLSILFSGVLTNLLTSIVFWFEQHIVLSQNAHSDTFRVVTTGRDLSNPFTPPLSYTRQSSNLSDLERESFRDDQQKKLLQKMVLDLRTKKSAYIDEEATRAFQFACELRQHLERGIAYKLNDGHEFIEQLRKQFIKLNSNTNGFVIFAHRDVINDFKSEKSKFLEIALNSLHYSSMSVQLEPGEIHVADSTTFNNNSEEYRTQFTFESELDSSGNLDNIKWNSSKLEVF